MDTPTTYVPERRPLSEADVHRVCETLAKEGVAYISIEKVRDRLGRGSNTTVGKWIRTWAKDRDRPEAGESTTADEAAGEAGDEPRLEVISLSEHQRRLAEQKALFGDLMAARIDAEVERTKAAVRSDLGREAEARVAAMKQDAVRAIEEAKAVEQRIAQSERERLLAEQRSRSLEEGGRIRRRSLIAGSIGGVVLGTALGALGLLAWWRPVAPVAVVAPAVPTPTGTKAEPQADTKTEAKPAEVAPPAPPAAAEVKPAEAVRPASEEKPVAP